MCIEANRPEETPNQDFFSVTYFRLTVNKNNQTDRGSLHQHNLLTGKIQHTANGLFFFIKIAVEKNSGLRRLYHGFQMFVNKKKNRLFRKQNSQSTF